MPLSFWRLFLGGATWAQNQCATHMENILNPRRGAHCWKLTEHLQNLQRSEQSVGVFLAISNVFCMFCMDLTWNQGVMCDETFVDLCRWHRGWFGPCAGSIRLARSGDVRGRLRWLHSVGLKLYELLRLYHFVQKVIIQEQILGCFTRTDLSMDIILIYFVLAWYDFGL